MATINYSVTNLGLLGTRKIITWAGIGEGDVCQPYDIGDNLIISGHFYGSGSVNGLGCEVNGSNEPGAPANGRSVGISASGGGAPNLNRPEFHTRWYYPVIVGSDTGDFTGHLLIGPLPLLT